MVLLRQIEIHAYMMTEGPQAGLNSLLLPLVTPID
jgi:hypothetical protein